MNVRYFAPYIIMAAALIAAGAIGYATYASSPIPALVTFTSQPATSTSPNTESLTYNPVPEHGAEEPAPTPEPPEQSSDTPETEATTPSSPDEPETEEIEEQQTTATVSRSGEPYPFPPLSSEDLNTNTRRALVNIVCTSSGEPVSPVSASGVIIDSRGVILTNAHVGQYVLLQDASPIDISCTARTGAPAAEPIDVGLLFIPDTWIAEHAHKIVESVPTGTGEHDYALLVLKDPEDGSERPDAFPAIRLDTREALLFPDDEVLVASYPAGFLGNVATRRDLYPASTVTEIQDVFTFAEDTIDLVSLGGIILAQSGSSGGAVVNGWNHLVGIVVTSSTADTTSERDLRAITLAHIERSIRAHTGAGLRDLVQDDIRAQARSFIEEHGDVLVAPLISAITD